MAIGKNAISRISNNGYSNVKTTAPDMENSAVVEEKKPPVKKTVAKATPKTAPKTTNSAPKKAPARTTPKSAPKATPKKVAPKKSLEKELELAPVKVATRIAGKECEYFGIGEELPIYLL